MVVDFTVDTSNIPEDGSPTPLSKSHLTLPFGQIKTILDNLANGAQAFDAMKVNDTAEDVTITDGACTITQSYAQITAQGGSGSDDLDTITLANGIFAFIRAASGSTITLKHGTDNITIVGDQDIELSGNDGALIFCAGSQISVIGSTSAGGGGGGIGGSTGGTDNAILRANGTGGSTLQNSSPLIDDNGNLTNVNSVRFKDATELTISGGSITRAQEYHSVDTQGEVASDVLNTIAGGTAGDHIYIFAVSDDRTVVVEHGTGNILLWGGADISLDESRKVLHLVYDGTNWNEVGNAASAAGGGSGALVEIVAPTELGSSQTTITLSSIPASYQDLILVLNARSDNANINLEITLNADTGTNYAYNRVTTNQTPADTVAHNANQTSIVIQAAHSTSSDTAGHMGGLRMEILAYANSAISRTGFWNSQRFSSAAALLKSNGSFAWENLADAVSSIELNLTAGDFVAGTTYALYGRGTAS